jgi:hypothetical protein
MRNHVAMTDEDLRGGELGVEPWWAPPPGMLKVNMAPRGDGAPWQLRGAWAKWERAVEHLSALEQEGRRWLATPAFDIVVTFDPARAAHIATFVVNERAPARLGAIAGDCFQNLRSSLDLLAWELAHRHWAGEAPRDERILRRVHFPISPVNADPDEFSKQELLSYFGSDVAARMVRYQWFERDRGAEPLRLLHAVSNVDKHRLLLTAVAACQLGNTRYDWEPPARRASVELLLKDGETYDDGTEITLIQFADDAYPDTVISVTHRPTAELRFTFGAGQFGPMTIAGCVWRVREILVSFEDFFATDRR